MQLTTSRSFEQKLVRGDLNALAIFEETGIGSRCELQGAESMSNLALTSPMNFL